jgi:hypothetical protein
MIIRLMISGMVCLVVGAILAMLGVIWCPLFWWDQSYLMWHPAPSLSPGVIFTFGIVVLGVLLIIIGIPLTVVGAAAGRRRSKRRIRGLSPISRRKRQTLESRRDKQRKGKPFWREGPSICPWCGTHVRPGDRVCSYCGGNL